MEHPRFNNQKHGQYDTKVDVGYYAPAARTTLNFRVLPVFICPPIERS
jgi:hypothetical protein